jgi:hypothetical protein
MPTISVTADLDFMDKFVSVAKQLIRLRSLVLPQYKKAALDLYEICQRLLEANENLSRWLYRFLYFDFRQADARGAFMEAVREYSTMKSGPEFRELKFRCGDIAAIYHAEISSKIGSWFRSNKKVGQAREAFGLLADADGSMVEFVYNRLIVDLDAYLSDVEALVEKNSFDEAEASRVAFKARLAPITRRLEQFSGELSELVIAFAHIAQQPITLARN